MGDLWERLEQDLIDNVYLDRDQAFEVCEFLRDEEYISEETLERIYE